MNEFTAWAVTTGEAGMRTQARGLARAAGARVEEKVLRFAAPWRWLPPGMVPAPLERLAPGGDVLAPPWPDLLVTCGRRSVGVSMAVRRQSGGRTLSVHIQDPLRRPEDFDLVIALTHDPIAEGGNVMKTITALHDVNAAELARAAAGPWAERLERLGRPLTGVLVGGPTRRSAFGAGEARSLAAALKTVRAGGAALAIVPSRRTPVFAREMLAEAFAGDDRTLLWDLAGDNPYRTVLARADALVVTGDSVSMVSEAIATGAPVEVFDLGEGRHERFLETLIAKGLAQRLGGAPAGWTPKGPYDATQLAGAAVRRLLEERAMAARPFQERTGVAGKAS